MYESVSQGNFTTRRRRRRQRRRRARFLRNLIILVLAGFVLYRLGPSLLPLDLPGTPGGEDLSGYPEALQTLWEKNEDARPFVEGYWENKDKTFPIDLTEEAASDTVPLLMQWDQRWGYENYSGGLFGCTGCGPTCLSMAALYLTGNPDYSPKYVAEYATKQGYAVSGSGTAWALISDGAADFGLTSEELPLSESAMSSALEQGGLIICVLGPGDFTDSGHFIVLTGYEDGAFTVNDPNSYLRSEQTWTYDRLSGQIKNLWALYKAQ